MSATEYDFLFKAIACGDGGVGKTALTIRFTKGFFEENYKMTIGVDFHIKTIDIQTMEGIKRCKLQLWDTGGQERFSSVRPMYYRGALGALLVFDLTNYESFEHLPNWIEEIKSNSRADIPMLLIGNKSDLVNERIVSESDIKAFSQKFGLYYLETSAKSGEKVSDCFAVLGYLMTGVEVPKELLGKKELIKPEEVSMQPIPAPEHEPEPEPEFAAPPIPEPEFAAPPVPEPKPKTTTDFTPAATNTVAFTPKGVLFSEKSPKPVSAPPGFKSKFPAPKSDKILSQEDVPLTASKSLKPASKPSEDKEPEIIIPKPEPLETERPAKESKPSQKTSLTQYLPQEDSSRGAFFQTLSEATSKKGGTVKSPESVSSYVPFTPKEMGPLQPVSEVSLRIIPNAEEIKKKEKEKKKPKVKGKKREKKRESKKGMVICRNCGAILSKEYLFCNRCGSRL